MEQELAEKFAMYAAAASGVLAALYFGAKAVVKVTATKRDDEVLEQLGKILDQLNIVDADEDGK